MENLQNSSSAYTAGRKGELIANCLQIFLGSPVTNPVNLGHPGPWRITISCCQPATGRRLGSRNMGMCLFHTWRDVALGEKLGVMSCHSRNHGKLYGKPIVSSNSWDNMMFHPGFPRKWSCAVHDAGGYFLPPLFWVMSRRKGCQREVSLHRGGLAILSRGRGGCVRLRALHFFQHKLRSDVLQL